MSEIFCSSTWVAQAAKHKFGGTEKTWQINFTKSIDKNLIHLNQVEDHRMQLITTGTMEASRKDKEATKGKRVRGHKLPITCLCVDSKNRRAYTGSKDGSIIMWCLKTKKILNKITPAHKRHINCLAISSDDKFLVSGGADKQIHVWSPADLSPIHTFSLHKKEVTSLAFRQGHPTLYSGSADQSVMLWTLEDDDNRCYIESLYGHESAVTSMDSLRREKVLTAGGRDQTIRIWKIVDQAQTVFQSTHESVDVARYIDDKTFVSGGEDGAICVWTTMKRNPVCRLSNAHEQEKGSQRYLTCWISALATYCLKEPKQAVKKRKLDEDEDNFVNNQRDEDEEEEVSEEDGEDEVNDSNETSNIYAMIASGSCNGKINIWKLLKTGGKFELELHQSIDCTGFINDLRITSDGKKLIAVSCQEHKFGRWWKLKSAKNSLLVFDIDKL